MKKVLFIALIFGFAACGKSDHDETVVMRFQELQGTNCGLLLSLSLEDEWRALDPINIEEFNISPSNGMEVIVQFEELLDQNSNCEFADPIEIQSIEIKG